MLVIVKIAVSVILLLMLLGIILFYAKIALTYDLKGLIDEHYVKGVGFFLFFLPLLGMFALIATGRYIVKVAILIRNFTIRRKSSNTKN
ncbi:hypothetical protein [Flavonifractor sp. An306]|uniref:hypothetical protein n=1 Tax=Flavonifractor sp. An306 TaxID=1965629 RepID=UPI00174E8030|nr:hypothetical protein [Flavonifractor sp. An306]